MSMELYVLSDNRLASIGEWQREIDASGLPLQLSAARPFDQLSGVLPVQLNERQTAFECTHWDAAEVISESPDIDFGHLWKYALAFRWTGNPYEGIAAYMAGGAYAKATGGIVLDCEEGKIITPNRTQEIAAELKQNIPMIEAAVRMVTERLQKF